MIANSLITQALTIVIALAIVFTYIQPTFAKIQSTQEEIKVLRAERVTVESVNVKLNQLITERNRIAERDIRRLLNYLPDKVDEIKVLRDIEIMTKTPGLSLNASALKYNTSGTGSNRAPTANTSLKEHIFSLTMLTSYEHLKTFLLLLEANHYPLEVGSLRVSPAEGGLLNVNLELVTYSRN
jgi:Tfp pilus assembly protein PilO